MTDSFDDPVAVGVRLVNLIETGSRESTYKLATLLALCHQAVENHTFDRGAGLEVPLVELADRVIALYWRQLEPYTPDSSSPLKQVKRGSSEILAEIEALRNSALRVGGAASLWRAAHLPEYARRRRSVAAHLARYPLAHLQRAEGGRSHVPFLYEDSALRKKMTISELDSISWTIRLKPGIALTLARAAPLVSPIIEGAWVQDVARWNDQSLPESTIGAYLFGVTRTALDDVRSPLVELQLGRCFYCEQRLAGDVHIDHVLPWSRTGLDDLTNLVAADSRCNLDKSASLPTAVHISRAAWRAGLAELAGVIEWQWDPARMLRAGEALLRTSPEGIRLWSGRHSLIALTYEERGRQLALLA